MYLLQQLLDYATPWTLPNVYLFTGNPIVKNNGAIVMGRGAAKQVRDTYPQIDITFGNILSIKKTLHLAWVTLPNEQHIGWFKVKEHWSDPAILSLIEESTKQLTNVALKNSDLTFHMNFPGVGNGKLNEHDILPILKTLPNNVTIYR